MYTMHSRMLVLAYRRVYEYVFLGCSSLGCCLADWPGSDWSNDNQMQMAAAYVTHRMRVNVFEHELKALHPNQKSSRVLDLEN